jgi:hypothetical protein
VVTFPVARIRFSRLIFVLLDGYFPAPVYPAIAPVSRELAALQSLREAIALEQAVVTGFPLDVLLFFALGSLLSDFSPCRLVLSFIVESS